MPLNLTVGVLQLEAEGNLAEFFQKTAKRVS